MSGAAEIAQALGGRRQGTGYLVRCPALGHEDRASSCHVEDAENGRLLAHCFAGCQWEDIRAGLEAKGLLPDRSGFPPTASLREAPIADPGPCREEEARRAKALRIWRSALPLDEKCPAAQYLRKTRGLTISLPPSLRWHPSLWHGPSGQELPTLVARVADPLTDEFLGVHRTFLLPDGSSKAAAEPAKMLLGRCAGGVVKLGEVREALLLGEGLESVLSAAQLSKAAFGSYLPAWAALSAGNLAKVRVPPGVSQIIVPSDGDEAGRAAARRLAESLRGSGAEVLIAPAPEGRDFNDLLRGGSYE